jgi:hypothetical protein
MAEDYAERPGRPAKDPSRRGELRRHYMWEAAREIGVLSMVFATLDAALYNVRLPMWGIVAWIVCGGVLLALGIYKAPEVGK